MSVETAPTFNTAIFNQANFATTSVSSTSNIGIDYLDANYTKFPTAQTGQTQTLYGLATTTDNIKLRNSLGYPITVGKGGGNIATNTCFGYNSLNSNTTGVDNTAFGYETLSANTTGSRNSALGYRSLKTNITGSDNTAVGEDALLVSTSSNNTAIGYKAGSANTTGGDNTYIGANDGTATQNTTGSNNTLIGYNATCGSANSNCTCIGRDATATASNQFVLGSASNTSIETKGELYPLYTSSPANGNFVGYQEFATNTTTTTISTLATDTIVLVLPTTFTTGVWLITGTASISATTATNTIITMGINNNANLTTTPGAIESQFCNGNTTVRLSVSSIQSFFASSQQFRLLVNTSASAVSISADGAFITATRLA